MSAEPPTALPSDSRVPLESVLCTEELNRRPARPPDYEAENRALEALVQALTDSPRTILQTLADKILEVFQSDSAGISLLTKEDGGKRFYWPAIAGAWKPHIGGGTPRDFGPCGDVLDRNLPLLFRHAERRYTYLLPVTPPLVECLLVPFYVEGKAVGTIWAIAHDDRRKFDLEDLRQLESLGRFASAAYQAVASLDMLEQRSKALGQSHSELAQRIAELQKTDREAQETRRAALNLMEDAVQSRHAMERLNAELRESEESLARELTSTRQLQSASALMIEGGDTHALYQKIVDAAVAIMHSDCASMQILDEGEDALRLLAWTGFDPAFSEIFALNRHDTKTSCSVARRAGHRVIVPDVETCDFIVGTPALADHRKTGIRAVQSTPLFTRGGRLLGMISTHWRTPHTPAESDLRQFDILARQAADLMERKQAEDELRELNRDLEKRVSERTAELQQANTALLRDMEERKKLEEQLLQAQKMESVGTLAGGIAHDFNNMLNIIQGYAFNLREYGTKDKQIGESLTVINETVQRGSALVQRLLTLARKGSTNLESVRANVLVEGLVALIRQTFPKTIEVTCSLEADLPPITADKNQIEQALLNLCVNARDAMSDGGRLTFKTQSIDGATLQGLGETLDGRYVCIEVSDTGMGMDESIRQRIFEPFFTTKDMEHGTGLGLSVVYGIVKNHRGFINVESKPTSGTSFRLYFPVATFEISAKEPIVEVAPKTAASNDAATVFLVEDEQSMVYVLEKTLLKHGYKVLKATDGEMAVKIYQRHKETIDIVLLDIGLPKMAGRDVLRKIKMENPDVKIVIASGYLEPQLKSEFANAGVQYFLPKPYKPDELIKTVQNLTHFSVK